MTALLPTVVLISLDTTRSDALSCYGVPPGPYQVETQTTPTLDALAANGLRFDRFFAHAPSTLSSHSTLFTGHDPHGHGVVRNGYPVDPALPTLAERLSGAGYDTVAVVGAAALERAMGLDRGFRLYDDDLPTLHGMMYQDSAAGVVQRTLAAVDARTDTEAPLFLFVHFYDPHTPYEPPGDPARYTTAQFRSLTRRARDGAAAPGEVERANALYLGEVTYMDAQIGVLLQGLGERGLLDPALIVAVADHGETLAEDHDYAWSHGSNVAHEIVSIPLVVQGRGLPLAQGAVVRSQAGLDGLARTIERAVGLAPTLGTGLDFFPLWRAGPVRDADGWPEGPTIPVFAEATRPRHAEVDGHWNNLQLHRAVWAGGYGAYAAPWLDEPLRFYDRGAAPHPDVLRVLEGDLRNWDATVPTHRDEQMAPSTARALKALGYVD